MATNFLLRLLLEMEVLPWMRRLRTTEDEVEGALCEAMISRVESSNTPEQRDPKEESGGYLPSTIRGSTAQQQGLYLSRLSPHPRRQYAVLQQQA